MAWHVILCSIGYIDVPNKGIEQASCDLHISPFSINLYFSNALLVLALSLLVLISSYCKCSLAWCQVRTFLLFTSWTHPLQMREYPLQYASTEIKNPTISTSDNFMCRCWEALTVAVQWSINLGKAAPFGITWVKVIPGENKNLIICRQGSRGGVSFTWSHDSNFIFQWGGYCHLEVCRNTLLNWKS